MVLIPNEVIFGPDPKFIEKYGLDKLSILDDWLNAILPILPQDNLEPLSEVNVTGEGRTKFCIANYTK